MASSDQYATFLTSARQWAAHRFVRHPDRYAEIYAIARKYRLDQVAADLSTYQAQDDDTPHPIDPRDRRPANLAAALEELGPCFIKLGQLMSTRPDVLPPAYIDALSRLQDEIAPAPSDRVVEIVERELGAPITELFASFEYEPLATASMAQVHRATLKDGTAVAVKVQRPDTHREIETDIEILHDVTSLATKYTPFGARYNLPDMVHELESSLDQEMDFRLEADNTRVIGQHLAEFPRLTTPKVYASHTARRVLTLEFVRGRHLTALSPAEIQALDAGNLAKDLLSAYLKQIIVDGIFHCDPHPGNILITDDRRLALLDFGMVGRFDAGEKDNIILLLLAFSERDGERVASTYLDLIEIPDHFNRRAFTQDVAALVSRYYDMSGSQMSIGTALLDLTKLAYSNHVPVPSVLTLLGKAMLNLDGTLQTLSPDLDPIELIREYMVEVMRRRVMAQFSPGRMSEWVIDMKHLIEHAPRRTETILTKLADDQLTVRLEGKRLEEALQDMNRAANRVSLGMIASAVIIAGGYIIGSRMRGSESR